MGHIRQVLHRQTNPAGLDYYFLRYVKFAGLEFRNVSVFESRVTEGIGMSLLSLVDMRLDFQRDVAYFKAPSETDRTLQRAMDASSISMSFPEADRLRIETVSLKSEFAFSQSRAESRRRDS